LKKVILYWYWVLRDQNNDLLVIRNCEMMHFEEWTQTKEWIRPFSPPNMMSAAKPFLVPMAAVNTVGELIGMSRAIIGQFLSSHQLSEIRVGVMQRAIGIFEENNNFDECL
jgi:hypothetical protein